MLCVAVIGGGPAGMMAAIAAAEGGASVLLLEKNGKLGKKLHITGKGRCNLTNNTDVPGLISHTINNPHFLNSAFYAFDSTALMEFFEERGVPLKTERGGRVFPESDKADDINKALGACLHKLGVEVRLHSEAATIEEGFCVRLKSGETLRADAVIIATGGLSYPSTGSTGDGYAFAKALSHTVKPTAPALVPLITAEPWVSALEGLSLKNVRLTAKLTNGKTVFEETGEMLFMHSGVSGPLVLSAGSYLCECFAEPGFSESGFIFIDLKPGLSPEKLDARLLRDFAENKNKNFANSLDGLLPKRLIETIISLSNIPPEKKVNAITRSERQSLAALLKALPLTVTATAGFREAVITAGGVCTREINPSTMMSKKLSGLFFAGEVIDTHALTGGYNLQIAFSTGRLAGQSAAML